VEVDAVTLMKALTEKRGSGLDASETPRKLAFAGAVEIRERLTNSEARSFRFACRQVTDGRLSAATKSRHLDLICAAQLQVSDE
jgi:hypothetical protein